MKTESHITHYHMILLL